MEEKKYIVVMRKCGEGYCYERNYEQIYLIGKKYRHDNGFVVYEEGFESLGEYQYPLAEKYLEVLAPVGVEKRGDKLFSWEIEIVREIPLEELRMNKVFDDAVAVNEKVVKENGEKIRREIEFLGIQREMENKIIDKKLNKIKKLIIALWIFVIITMIGIPLLLTWLR